MSPGAEVTRLDATDLGVEMPGRAVQEILGGVDVAGTSTPVYMALSSAVQILTPSSAPCILALSMHLKRAPVRMSPSTEDFASSTGAALRPTDSRSKRRKEKGKRANRFESISIT